MENNTSFRNDFTSKLSENFDPNLVQTVLMIFDFVSSGYTIQKSCTELDIIKDIPDEVFSFIASKSVENKSKGTIKQYSYKLAHFFRTLHKSVKNITSNDIRIYLYNFKKERNASDRYLETIRITLNSFFHWCVINDYIEKNPVEKIEKIKSRIVHKTSLDSLEIETIRANTQNIREKAIIDFLYSTGCRVSECADLMKEDISFENHSAHIKHGKGDKERTVYFNAESEISLKKYLESRDDEENALFVSERSPHKPLSSHAIELIVSKIGKRSGMHLYPHKLRHTFCTMGIRSGMRIEEVQNLMGHTSPKTTLIYCDLNETRIRDEYQRCFN